MEEEVSSRRFDPLDLLQMRLLAKLPPGRRIRAMLDAQALARGLIRGRLRRLYPDASDREWSLKLLEEVERGKRMQKRTIGRRRRQQP